MNLYTKGKIIEPYFPTVFEAWGGGGGGGGLGAGGGGGGAIPRVPTRLVPPTLYAANKVTAN
jgi:hypothetical protein